MIILSVLTTPDSTIKTEGLSSVQDYDDSRMMDGQTETRLWKEQGQHDELWYDWYARVMNKQNITQI